MYKSTGFKPHKHQYYQSMQQFETNPLQPISIPPSYAVNPQFNGYDVKDNSLKLSIQKLIKENAELSEHLQRERQKNYDLLEIKRKMEDDIKKMEFQIQRLGIHGNLTNREAQIKNRQILQDNTKTKRQLDTYFQDIKNLQSEVRKHLNQIQQLMKQKQDMVKQNVSLLSHVSDLKQKLSVKQNQNIQLQNYVQILLQEVRKLEKMGKIEMKNGGREGREGRQTSIHDLVTIRSIQEKNNGKSSENSRQQIKYYAYESPQNMMNGKMNGKYHKQELSTNPSLNKIALVSGYSSPHALLHSQFQRINQQHSEQPEPSPRSFTNKKISKKLQLSSSPVAIHTSAHLSLQSPSVISYANNRSPVLEQLRLNTQSIGSQDKYQYSHYVSGHKEGAQRQASQRMFLGSQEKKEVKEQVAGLRDQLVQQLIRKYYMGAIQVAERQKKNSLKLFITYMTAKIATLSQMSQNYLQARMMVSETCPTVRLKYEPHNPNSSHKNPSQSQLIQKNTQQVYKIFQSIKTNAKKQKNINGQYLALFRYLTLLHKLDTNVDGLLVQSIKHAVAKQVYRISQFVDGKGAMEGMEGDD